MFNLALESPDFMSGLKDSFSGVNASNASNVSNTSNASNTANSSAEGISSTLLGAAEEGGNGPPHSVDVSSVSPMLLEGEEEVEEEAEEASLSYFIPNADIAGIRGQLFDTAFYSFSLLLLPAIVMLCLYWLIRALLYCYTCGHRFSCASESVKKHWLRWATFYYSLCLSTGLSIKFSALLLSDAAKGCFLP